MCVPRPACALLSLLVLGGLPLSATSQPAAGPAPSRAGELLSEIRFKRVRILSQFESQRSGGAAGVNPADVKIAVGAAVPHLVLRQIVTVAAGKDPIATMEFGPAGGTLSTLATVVPSDVRITLTVVFVPDANHPSVVRVFDQKVEPAGLVGLVQVFTDETNLFVDRGFYGQYGDFLIATLKTKSAVGSEFSLLNRPLTVATSTGITPRDVDFIYVADEEPAALSLEISGRLCGCVPGPLGSLTREKLKTTILLGVIWNGTTHRPEFTALK